MPKEPGIPMQNLTIMESIRFDTGLWITWGIISIALIILVAFLMFRPLTSDHQVVSAEPSSDEHRNNPIRSPILDYLSVGLILCLPTLFIGVALLSVLPGHISSASNHANIREYYGIQNRTTPEQLIPDMNGKITTIEGVITKTPLGETQHDILYLYREEGHAFLATRNTSPTGVVWLTPLPKAISD